MIDQTRLYIQTAPTTYRSFAWFHNNKPNEMLVGLYGLRTKQPTFRYMWPDRELTQDELSNVRYEYKDKIGVNYKVDHFTCHADGRFHLKTVGHKELYIQKVRRCAPLGPDTEIFLELILQIDLSENYNLTRSSPKRPHFSLRVPEKSCTTIRAMFSGVNYNLEAQFAATLAKAGGIVPAARLVSGTLKGIFAAHSGQLGQEALQSRPRGTIISFKFPAADGSWRIKTFLFD